MNSPRGGDDLGEVVADDNMVASDGGGGGGTWRLRLDCGELASLVVGAVGRRDWE